MNREDVLLLVAAVAPGKFPKADRYAEKVITEILREELAKSASAKA